MLQPVVAATPNACPGADLFTNGVPISLHIQITDSNLDVLRKEPREFVSALLAEDQARYTNVALHLKGSVGSFRPVDDKPSLTLDFCRFNPGQKFHGLRRIHLNNSLEDPSYCNEMLGSELFRQTGVPAPRVSRAVVTLNGRRLGLYVLKEGFTEDFLGCYFTHPSDNLYEPDEGHDVNQRLKRTSVEAPRSDRSGLRALADAVRDPDQPRRWGRLDKVLATDEFISFMALEVILGHRDGYCLARNNFRIYEDADTGKMWFFPHGMDQLWRNPEAPWRPQMSGLVARSILDTAEGKSRYRDRFNHLVRNVLQPELLARRLDESVAQLRPALPPGELAAIQNETTQLKDRIKQRKASLDSQLVQPELKGLLFDTGRAQLEGWSKFEPPSQGSMEMCKSPDGIAALHILTRSETASSWRTKALLNPGRYRFEAKVSAFGVKPLPFGVHQGVGLRIGGRTRQSQNLLGNAPWSTLQTEFQIDDEAAEVEFICELRASAGEAWFDAASLTVVRLP